MPSASSARPPTADFASVMGIGYHPTDSFRWHTDMAGDDGWVLSISLGAAATFEYLPRSADPTRLCALALAECSILFLYQPACECLTMDLQIVYTHRLNRR